MQSSLSKGMGAKPDILPPVRPGAGGPLTPQRPQAAHGRGLTLDLASELGILSTLRATIGLHHEALEDPDLMLCLAEGETSLLELLDRVLDADLEDESLIAGLKLSKDTLSARLHRLQERRQSRRAVLEQALFLLQRKSLERPCATLTLSQRPPAVVVEEEAQIPARFFELQPALDRRAVKQALEQGEEVPGAHLSDGCLTLTVRRR